MARHGRTSWNARGLFQGHADIPLDAEGEAQAAALAATLAPLRPDRIVVSDLARARQTAAPLAVATGLDLEIDHRMREVDVGTWEGITAADAAARFPDDYRAWTAGHDTRRGGGETRSDGGRRAADAIVEHLLAAGDGTLVIVISHGLVLRAALDELSSRGLVDIDGPSAPFANAAWLDLRAEVPTT